MFFSLFSFFLTVAREEENEIDGINKSREKKPIIYLLEIGNGDWNIEID